MFCDSLQTSGGVIIAGIFLPTSEGLGAADTRMEYHYGQRQILSGTVDPMRSVDERGGERN